MTISTFAGKQVLVADENGAGHVPQLLRDWRRRQAQDQKNVARQEFFEAARDQRVWRDRKCERGDVGTQFNDAAKYIEGHGRSEDGSNDQSPERKGIQSRRSRKARGLGRDSD